MTDNGSGRGDDRLEPTIVPVHRPLPDKPQVRGAGGRRLTAIVGSVLALAGLVAVFVYLPNRVERAQPAEESAVADPLPVESSAPALTEAEIAALTAQAESLLAQLIEQRQDLDQLSAASWGDTTWSSYVATSDMADEAFLDGDLLTAVDEYQAALAMGKELIAHSERTVAEAIAAGQQAIAVGDSELAVSQFELALGIDPDNAAAGRGLERARALPEVLAAMRRGDDLEHAGQLEQAVAAYRDALTIDPAYADARTRIGDLSRQIENARFDRLLTDGFAAIDEGRYDRAAEVFTDALGMRPESAEARAGLTRAEEGQQGQAIRAADARGDAFERRELWAEAIERYREALATDPGLSFAIEGLERSQQRADLDAKLEALIATPRRLLQDNVLEEARELLARARAIPEPGARLESQQTRLAQLITIASTPIPVTLLSDGQTEVVIHRVGEIGSFEHMEIELKPGEYTAVGQRDGYRDVRMVLVVLPGTKRDPVTIVCSERV